MIKGIVVATDASPAANRAVDLAADMAGRYGVGLTVVHVIRAMQQLPDELRAMAEVERLEGQRAEVLNFVADKIVSEARDRARDAGAATVDTVIGEGDPATAIIDQAQASGADLIVMGTRGRSDIKSMLLGSVSRKVSNLCTVNCLMVR